MLDFFRRYQRYFFLVITVVIVISFSFFGTYSTLGSDTWREQIAFKAINGREVTRFDLDEMAVFLATDNEDKIYYGGVWGPNFLNDGVIRKDFLETGLGQELALAYREDLKADIDRRLAKEKKYRLYSHPEARFLGVANVWNYFAPDMKGYFDKLQAAQDALDPDIWNSRIQLYLAERKLPPSSVKYLLRYQEKQYQWLKPDDQLNETDLSLFGYHTLEDWFSPYFTRLVSEFIINAAILAEAQGYQVSKAEVLSDLVRHTQQSYQQNQNNPHLGVASAEEYFQEQLRRLNMDQSRAIKVWRQVLLFRRYFHDAGATALVDAMASQRLQQFGEENVSLDLYQLPASLKLASYEDLQKFEVYLRAVAKQNQSKPLALPEKFLTVAEINKEYPELIQKRYELEVAQVPFSHLQAKIALRELWNWEVDEQHWQELVKQFPVLAVKAGNNREERFEALDGLDATTRSMVDVFAKQAMIKAHPEWIDQALSNAKSEKMVVGLRVQGGKMPFAGLNQKEKRQALISALDKAPLGEKVGADSPLSLFSADDKTYYRITVLDRVKEPEILTFAEARTDGTLDEISNRMLEKHYLAVREQHPLLYQKENKEWQSFQAVRDLVASEFFENVLTALDSLQKTTGNDLDKNMQDKASKSSWNKDRAASLRLYGYLKTIKEKLEKDPTKAQQWIQTVAAKTDAQPGEIAEKTLVRQPLADQWKMEQSTIVVDRQNPNGSINIAEALKLNDNSWSAIETPVNGDLVFYQVKNHGITEAESKIIAEQIRKMQTLLGAEAQRHLMRQVLQELKSKEAISLAYLNMPHEEIPFQENENMSAEF